MWFRKVPVQIPCEVPEGSGADAYKRFRCFFMAQTFKFYGIFF